MKQILLLAAVLLLAPLGVAHGAPEPLGHETRLVHDDNDDTLLYAVQGQGVLDQIAMDVREGYSVVHQEPMLIFKLSLNDACTSEVPEPLVANCGTITETIQFDAPTGTQTITLTSEDQGATWTTNAPYLVQPYLLNDGDRFAVEVGQTFSALEIQVGDTISNFLASTDLSGSEGDVMPQGLTPGAPEVWVPTMGLRFEAESYTIKAPDFYATISLDADPASHLDPDAMVQQTLTVANDLDVDQSYVVLVAGTNGLHTTVSDGANSGAALSFALEAGTSLDFTVMAHNMAMETGMANWTITVLSGLGGFNQLTYELHIEAPVACPSGDGRGHDEGHDEMGMDMGAETNCDDAVGPGEHGNDEHTDDPSHNADGHEHEEESTPGFGFALVILALAGVAIARRP